MASKSKGGGQGGDTTTGMHWKWDRSKLVQKCTCGYRGECKVCKNRRNSSRYYYRHFAKDGPKLPQGDKEAKVGKDFIRGRKYDWDRTVGMSKEEIGKEEWYEDC